MGAIRRIRTDGLVVSSNKPWYHLASLKSTYGGWLFLFSKGGLRGKKGGFAFFPLGPGVRTLCFPPFAFIMHAGSPKNAFFKKGFLP